ncbi:MAG: serine/threonine protein kinase [Cyanobacteria bacterium HKST-UBA02]|nr:serine/threonine protein kinase [Cyanobacteria bacterium HKST-UBA02]
MSDELREKQHQPELKVGEETLDSGEQAELPSETDDLAGKTIGGHYEVLSRIGSGGMSTVYRARHTHLDRTVALKVMLPRLVNDDKTTRRFQQEARAASELKHENICGVSEFAVDESGRAFIVMEHVEGRSLADMIAAEGRMSADRALAIVSQICRGLEHAHSKGVIHRDLKPANVILVEDGEEGTARIVDFGIAKVFREDQTGPDLTQTGEVFGTPKYMSPEQCMGRRVDNRSDVYSLGCLMCEIITGNPPFTAQSSIEVIMRHVGEEPELDPALLSPDLRYIIGKCLAKNPDDRYADASAVLEDIETVLGGGRLSRIKTGRWHVNLYLAMIALAMVCILGSSASFVNAALKKQEAQKQWIVEETRARELIAANDLPGAEERMERALELARKSNQGELITLTLTKLSDLENQQGKSEEAREHSRQAEERPRVSALKEVFLALSLLFIAAGFLILIPCLHFFGPRSVRGSARMTLKDLFTGSRNRD